jgi:hypothetical protein
MPIEVKELVIRATIDPKGGEAKKGADAATENRQELVRECVEQVLEILRRERER